MQKIFLSFLHSVQLLEKTLNFDKTEISHSSPR